MSSDEEDEPAEEDPRIAQLYGAADKKSPEEWAQLVDAVGTKDAIVYGSMCMQHQNVRAHFVVMALIDADDGTLAECVEAKRAHLKAAVSAGGEKAGVFLLAALEGFLANDVAAEDREAAIGSFRKALKVLWEYELVSEDEIREWQADENAGRILKVPPADGRRLHEQGRVFLELWRQRTSNPHAWVTDSRSHSWPWQSRALIEFASPRGPLAWPRAPSIFTAPSMSHRVDRGED